MPPADLERICRSREQCKFNKLHPHGTDLTFLTVIDSFLDKLQKERPCDVLKDEIATKGDFPSVYHFRICDFSAKS